MMSGQSCLVAIICDANYNVKNYFTAKRLSFLLDGKAVVTICLLLLKSIFL